MIVNHNFHLRNILNTKKVKSNSLAWIKLCWYTFCAAVKLAPMKNFLLVGGLTIK